jgi:glutamyl-Q tRNA(Asp) synthetase
LHFGSLVAAVGSYLEAQAHDGEWLVRIEDLDRPRVVPGAADEILSAIEACGMQWDGVVVYQSSRNTAYHAAVHELRQQGRLYACACSRREIADSAISGIEGFVYPGTCRDGLPSSRKARAWRLRTQGAVIRFEDAVQGPVEHDLERQIGDFVVYRSDSAYAYQLAVSVDDAEQGITHIVRGADLLDSTPRQIYLQRLLGVTTPCYAHLPVAVNRLGEKLSKQTLAQPVGTANIASSLVQALRFLGQNPPGDLRTAGLSEIWRWATENWSVDRIPHMRTQRVEQAA